MTEQQARKLAKQERYYSARKIRGNWVVWDAQADHVVEFDRIVQVEGDTSKEFNNKMLQAFAKHTLKNS